MKWGQLHHPAFQAPLLKEEGINLLLFKEEYPEGGRWCNLKLNAANLQ
jgi:hypothetical protein